MQTTDFKKGLSITSIYFLIPALAYFLLFCILTFPLILRFSTHFFTEPHLDGLQNVWNIWWVDKSITQLHQTPWHTQYLHYPYGVSLLGHTLNPFNGLLGIVFLKFFSLLQTYNALVIFSFVTGGLTTFWLAYYLSRTYWSSIVAGFIFTFSSYHFAHLAAGHLQLMALEWMPLFILCVHILITKPKVKIAIISGLVLFLIILCDYYYFFYSVLIFIFMIAGEAIRKRQLFFIKKEHRPSFIIFSAVSLATCAPLIISLLTLNFMDPLLGSHSSSIFSADLLAPFIPGAFWRFSNLTQFYWSRIQGNSYECSIYLGLAVIFVLIYVWRKRRMIKSPSLSFWYFICLFFFIMSLGPRLNIFGFAVPFLRLPYELLCFLFPPLSLSGVPVRMMVIVYLSAAIIFAIGAPVLFQGHRYRKLLIILVVSIILFEYLPADMPSAKIIIPESIRILKRQPQEGGVLDMVSHYAFALYFQTIYEKPMAFGYVSRISTSTNKRADELASAIVQQDFDRLYYDFKIRYLIAPVALKVKSNKLSIKLLHQDDVAKLYSLGAQKETTKFSY